MARAIGALLALATAFPALAVSFGQDDRVAVERDPGEANDAIGLLVHEAPGGQYAAGAATLVSPCHILTAYHVAGGGEEVDAETTAMFYIGEGQVGPRYDDFDHFAIGAKARAVAWGDYHPLPKNEGSPEPSALEQDDGWQDWALMKLDDCLGEKDRGYGYMRLLALSTRELTRLGGLARARTLGFPVDKDAAKLWLDPDCRIVGQIYASGWQHDCITLPGNSGGPIIAADPKTGEDRIVAINVSHIGVEGLSDMDSDTLFLSADDPTYYEYLSIAVPVSAFAEKIAPFLSTDSGLASIKNDSSGTKYEMGSEAIAIADLTTALQERPGNAGLLVLRGLWSASGGDIEAALADWAAAESNEEERPRARYERARMLLDLGGAEFLGQAEDIFADLMEEFPDNPELRHFRGLTRARQEDNDGAIEDFDIALKARPKSAVLHNDRGDVYRALRDYDSALADYDRAIKYAPDWPEAWRDRGYLQHLRARYGKAERDFRQALLINERDAEAMNGLGLIALSQGDGEKAREEFSRAIAALPGSSVYYANRGAASWVGGEMEAAIEDFDRSIALDPGEPYIWMFEYLALARLGRRQEAAHRLAQYLDDPETGPDWPRPLMEYYLGRVGAEAVDAALAKTPAAKADDYRFDRDFYLGQWALVRGDESSAKLRLKEVLDSELREYLEYDLARADYLALGGEAAE